MGNGLLSQLTMNIGKKYVSHLCSIGSLQIKKAAVNFGDREMDWGVDGEKNATI